MAARKLWPVCPFDHLDRSFSPAVAVDPDDPMVLLRPDLFTTKQSPQPDKEAAE